MLALSGCASQSIDAPTRADLGIALIRLNDAGPPKGPDGSCWASDTTPAVIETVTEQQIITDEVRDAAGKVTTPAAFETKTHQRMVQEHEDVWFRAPCPAEITVGYVATLQRALKARGLYQQPVTGLMDAATSEAIRQFQADRGLDSPQLSLAAAQELGISATALADL